MRSLINLVQEAQGEASAEDVWDVIHEFSDSLQTAMHHDPEAFFNEVYPEDNQNFPQLFIGGYPADGFNKESVRKLVQPLVVKLETMGWFLSKQFETQYASFDDDEEEGLEPQKLMYLGWFPHRGDNEMVDSRAWHISPTTNRASILQNGIKAGRGGSDFIHTSNNRVYVIIDDFHIDDIIKDIRKHRPDWTSLDIWQIYTWDCVDEWYEDIELPGTAAWTPHDIPADAVSLIETRA